MKLNQNDSKCKPQNRHLKAFEQIAAALKGYTEKCVISFVDVYAKNKKNMELLDSYGLEKNELLSFSKQMAEISKKNGMTIGSLAIKWEGERSNVRRNIFATQY